MLQSKSNNADSAEECFPSSSSAIVSSVKKQSSSVALENKSPESYWLLCCISKDKAIDFHQSSFGKVIHNHGTLSQDTSFMKTVCWWAHSVLCVSKRTCFYADNVGFLKRTSFLKIWIWELRINWANLRHIHASHYGNESRQFSIPTLAYVKNHTQRGTSILT